VCLLRQDEKERERGIRKQWSVLRADLVFESLFTKNQTHANENALLGKQTNESKTNDNIHI
jgi:predicted NAD-dependent protein-ADP-ribosyltransferase YbiA (DUF1768 family)